MSLNDFKLVSAHQQTNFICVFCLVCLDLCTRLIDMNREIIVQTPQHLLWSVLLSLPVLLPVLLASCPPVNRILLDSATAVHYCVYLCVCVWFSLCVQVLVSKSALAFMMYLAHEM